MNNPITEELIAFKRSVIESIYTAKVNVYYTTNEYSEDSNFKKPVKKMILENEPCRVSGHSTRVTDGSPKEAYKQVTLIIAPEHDIPPGSFIEVTYNGITETYNRISDCKQYSDHQTLTLRAYREGKEHYA